MRPAERITSGQITGRNDDGGATMGSGPAISSFDAGNSSDCVVSRRRIAEVLVHSLSLDSANRRTFELVAERGWARDDFNGLFAVVLGTLVLQGLTMKPLIRHVGLTDDDPVGREIRLGRTMAYQSLLDATATDDTLAAKLLRKEYGAIIELNARREPDTPVDEVPGGPLRRRAIAVAPQRAFELRRDDVIGDDAYRVLV